MIAFYLSGGIPVYAFSLFLGLGTAAGLALVAWQAPSGAAAGRVNAGLWAGLGALLGGRIAYALLHWPYFREHTAEVLQIYLGGLSWFGALAGGLLLLGLYAWRTQQSFAVLADSLLPLLACLAIAAWLGCWLDGCAYGPASGAWWALPARDAWGAVTRRWPLQLFGALAALALFAGLERLRPGLRTPGALASLGLLGLSLELLLLIPLQAAPSRLWRGLPLGLWAALIVLLFAALALALAARTEADGG